ncbi:DNA recombination protein RmuC [Aureimonas mangrovi]|uniref:DNA recombination protein RmuC n=1 Tax=Aureimonas mangrovi TaxID=2758041 RepID=UPI00163D7D73|nr:DNA recombination protein RmuC [Aureimonas mangrovi]
MDASLLDRVLFPLLGFDVTLGVTMLAAIALLAVILVLRAGAARRDAEQRAEAAEERVEAVLRGQSELSGRMQTMAEIFGGRQAEMTRVLAERLDGVGSRVNQSLGQAARETGETLTRLSERLAVIDRAQGEIRNLAGEVVRLQDILANKQARGAFGQGRMEAIVMDALPHGAYSFQATLSNGKRPDCLIVMPNGAPSLAIDAKFPLEAWSALREAEDEPARASAAQRLRRDMDVHVRAVAEKYLLPGETQDTAFLFVPSESIFAELNERFEDVVQKAHRARVVIVSPALLMLSIQVVQALLKDQRMRREAGRIQKEVALLADDMQRLDARVGALRTHFGQTGRDIDQILISTEKIVRRGERIASVDLGEADTDASSRECDETGENADLLAFSRSPS